MARNKATPKTKSNHNLQRCIEVYGHIFADPHTELIKEHQEELAKRHCTPEQITHLGYRSLGHKRKGLIDSCVKKFGKEGLDGVPGFYRKSGGDPQLAGGSGMLVPVRDRKGNICGVKIRTNDWIDKSGKRQGGKYLQLSSNPETKGDDGKLSYPNGTAAKVFVHFPIVVGDCKIAEDQVLRITEGEIKADLATLISDVYTISIPGIGMWKMVVSMIVNPTPKSIWLAFDSDKDKEVSTSNSDPDPKPFAVGVALAKLYETLRNQNLDVRIEHWDAKYGKGIDNVLAANKGKHLILWENEEAEEFVEEMLREGLPRGWVYVASIKRLVDITEEGREMMDKESWSDFHSDWPIFEDIEGKAIDFALKQKHFRKVRKIAYTPGEEMFYMQGRISCYNLWRPSTLVAVPGDPAPFIKHCEYMIPDETTREVFYNYLAYMIQYPGEKINWAIILQGTQGTGKSYFSRVMKFCLGDHNVNTPSNENLHEKYTAWRYGCQLAVFHEVKTGTGRIDIMNMLKPVITDETVVVREMWKPAYEQKNVLNLLMLTNHKDAITIEKTDRRYCVIFSPAVPKSDAAYYADLFKWTNDNAGVLLHWFQNRCLKNFLPMVKAHAPWTDSKTEMVGDSATGIEQWMERCIADGADPFRGNVVTVEDIMSKIPPEVKGRVQLKESTLRSIMQGMGCQGPRRITINVETQIPEDDRPADDHKKPWRASVWSVRNHAFLVGGIGEDGEPIEAAEEADVRAEYLLGRIDRF